MCCSLVLLAILCCMFRLLGSIVWLFSFVLFDSQGTQKEEYIAFISLVVSCTSVECPFAIGIIILIS